MTQRPRYEVEMKLISTGMGFKKKYNYSPHTYIVNQRLVEVQETARSQGLVNVTDQVLEMTREVTGATELQFVDFTPISIFKCIFRAALISIILTPPTLP
jgi:hypothetical protein